ncbi:MAG: hypothetical protein Q8O12_05390 [Candidatus Omnitrophota bacterium]|nr:hypothetical protein [Candidatus Omnitrophota bacterium]
MKYIKIIASIVVFILAAAISAPAMDFGIDKAISLNFYFSDAKRIVSELRIDNLDIKGAALSGNIILKAKVLKNKGLFGKLDSANMTLNSKALPDLKIFFKLTGGTVRIYSLRFGKSYCLSGTVGLKRPFETDIYFEILRANLRDIAIVTNAKKPDVVTGVMNGLLKITGPLDNLQSSGFIGGRQGKIGPIWYDSAEIKIEGRGPIINIVESRIKQEKATFTLEGYVDLRTIASSDPMRYLKMKSDMKTIVWDGWDIEKDGADSMKMVKGIGDNMSVGFKTFAREELPPYQKRDKEDEMSVEYKLDGENHAFQMKLKENEEFFGVEHKRKF